MNFHGGNIYECESGVVDFSANINPLGVPESFKEMLQNSLDEFTRYPDINYTELRTAIADYIKHVDIDSIVPGNGAVELLYKAIGMSGKNKVIGLAPAFSEYKRAALFYGLEFYGIAGFDKDFETIDIDKLAEAADENSVVVVCNPNNPTGTLTSKSKMIRLADRLMEKGSKLIVDEAFMEFTPDYPANSMASELNRYHNVLVVKAATKFFGMPGIRLGYAICENKHWLNKVKKGLEPWNVNTAAVIAGRSVLKDYAYIMKSREWIERERSYVYNSLAAISGLKVYKSSANFHLIRLLDTSLDAWQLKNKMLTHGILIRTPEGFECLDGQYVRLAVKNRENNQSLIKYLYEYIEK